MNKNCNLKMHRDYIDNIGTWLKHYSADIQEIKVLEKTNEMIIFYYKFDKNGVKLEYAD